MKLSPVFRAIAVCAVLCVFSALGLGAPQVLIAKLHVASKQLDADPNGALVEFIAQEFDQDGRVHPIAWGLSDPYFRTAVDSNLIKNPPKEPSLEQALQVGAKLQTDYVLAVTVRKEGSTLFAVADLYRKGQSVWHDPSPDDPMAKVLIHNAAIADRRQRNSKNKIELTPASEREIQVSNSGDDLDNELASLARVWAMGVENGPFKSLDPHFKSQPPPVDKGQAPVVVQPPPAPKATDNSALSDAAKLLASGQNSQAIDMLRRAVDAQPLDVERRKALIDTLEKCGQPDLAAAEARRASALMPDRIEFRILAAHAFLAAGEPDEARNDLNEAVARDPNDPDTRLLLGETDIYKLDLPNAIQQLDFVIKEKPSAEASYQHAIAECLNGDGQAAQQDLAAASKLGLPNDPASISSRYSQTETYLEASEADFGPQLRSLLQLARVRSDSTVADTISKLNARVDAENTLLGAIAAPDSHKRSWAQKLLALKLLLEALSDLADYQKSHSDDAIEDATINVGEGLKDLESARQAFRQEL